MMKDWKEAVRGALFGFGLFFTCLGVTSTVVFVLDRLNVCVR